MAFGNYKTAYDEMAEISKHNYGVKRWKASPLSNFNNAYVRILNGTPLDRDEEDPDDEIPASEVEYAVYMGEYMWYTAGRPYYRVYPDYVRVFSGTSLDIPVKYIQVPYPSFELRFDGGVTLGGNNVESVLVHVGTPEEVFSEMMGRLGAPGAYAAARDEAYAEIEDPQTAASVADTVSRGRRLILSMQGPGLDPSASPGREIRAYIVRLPLTGEDDMTLDEWLADGRRPEERRDPDQDEIDRILRVALSVSFLATGLDRIIEPEVLNSDFPAYLEAVNRHDRARVDQMVARERRHSSREGFVIGRPESLLGRRQEGSEEVADQSGNELRFQHQRRGHLHRYWTKNDAGEPQLTMRFVRQHTVRPDLPVPPVGESRPGSRTLRTESEMRS